MAFVLKQSDSYTWPVTFDIPVDGGRHERQTFDGEFKRLPQSKIGPMVAELQKHVRGKLAPYEYPKEIEFIEALPMTTTGKVQRRVLRLREEERARVVS